MSARMFDGLQAAAEREKLLTARVQSLSGSKPVVAAVVFREDEGSQLYTRLKSEAAARVGIGYRVHNVQLAQPPAEIRQLVRQLNVDPEITGIILQKPRRAAWSAAQATQQDASQYQAWWRSLTSELDSKKDVDGLSPQTLASILEGSWQAQHRVLPATVKAVLICLEAAGVLELPHKVAILGKSDLLGTPLYGELLRQGHQVELCGRAEIGEHLADPLALKEFEVIISATGKRHLVTGQMIRSGAVVVDVGEPAPDVQRLTVEPVAAFLTPVPGGVGPLTVVSLLENAVELI